MSERTDRDLVEQAQQGDRTAVGELFSRYWRAARAAAFGVTGEFASAEDAAAEAFKQALAGIESLRDPDRFGSWLRTIVIRGARLLRNSRHAATGAFVGDLPDPNEHPDQVLLRAQLRALVQQAVRELPEPLRETMALVYFEGYDPDIAARFLEIPPGTLRRRLHDGRARLRITVEQVLQGNKQMDEERKLQIRSLQTMIEKGDIYQALRGSLELHPPNGELVDTILRRSMDATCEPQNSATGEQLMEPVHRVAQQLLRPSVRTSDPANPVGSVTAAIRKALPDFRDWPLDASAAAVRFLSTAGAYRDRLQAVLPPGFAEGRPGAFLRVTRAMVRLSGDGRVQSIFEHLKDSPDERSFREPVNELRLSDAIDLTWMVTGTLELRSVQELLEHLTSAVLPGAQVRASTYAEPRYRSALQLRIGDLAARAAHGGVLAEWPGRPTGVDAAHVRIFLEPWATLQSGEAMELDPLPKMEN